MQVETRESLEARISASQRELHDLEAQFAMDRELMVAKEAQLLQEKILTLCTSSSRPRTLVA
jgi:hypothetical protein